MTESINIKDLQMQFISTKIDNYSNSINYFKVTDPLGLKKLKLVNKMSDKLYKPFWDTDKEETMLKVKDIRTKRKDLLRKHLYECDVELVPYFGDKPECALKGYFAKLTNIRDVKEVDVLASDDDST